jgi:hypothetical protein
MKLDITPYLEPSYNCLDVLVYTVARNWGCEHRLMFADAWRFRYDRAPADTASLTFEEVLDVKELVEARDTEQALAEQHGLVMRKTDMTGVEQAIAFLKGEFQQGSPVAIGVDAFHCHWSNAFHKYHLGHYCLGVGIEDDGQHLIVFDPYLTMEVQRFPVSDYAESLQDTERPKDCLSFRREPPPSGPPDWRRILDRSTTTMLGAEGGSRFQQMRDLAHDIEKYMDFHQEVARHADPYASGMVLYFKTLSFSRLNYSECLAHLGHATGREELVQAAARMKEQGDNIYKIFLLLMKMSLTPHRFKASEIARRLVEVADREEALARDLANLAKSSVGAAPNLMAEAR